MQPKFENHEYFQFAESVLSLIRSNPEAERLIENPRELVNELKITNVLKLPEILPYIKRLEADHNLSTWLKSAGDSFTPANTAFAFAASGYLLKPIIMILQKYKTMTPSHEQLLDSLKEFEKIWMEQYECDFCIPLHNFQSNIDIITVSDVMSITKFDINKNEEHSIVKIYGSIFGTNVMPFVFLHNKLSYLFKVTNQNTK